jgi:hypothetical protein
LDNPGIQELRKFEFQKKARFQRSDLLQFFTRAFDLQRKFPDRAILRYAVSRLSASAVKTANVELTQALILQAVTHEPGVWPMAIKQLRFLHSVHSVKDLSKIADVIHGMIRRRAPLNHSSEVAWSLWAALVFGLKIAKAAVNGVVRMADDCSTLLLLHAAELGLTEIKPRMSAVTRLLSPEVLRGPHWLVAYEALVRGWVTGPGTTDYIARDPIFKFLRQQNVNFYDTAEIPTLEAAAKEAAAKEAAEEEAAEEEEVVGIYGI